MLDVTKDDIAKLDSILSTSVWPVPNVKMSVYKNRRGPHTGVYLWGVSNLGTCRTQWYFATRWNYELIDIADLKIMVQDAPAPWENGT